MLAWVGGSLLVLLVVLYFVVTSAAFFKGVILPRVGQSLNAQITVSDASIHPFSEVTLRDLKVEAQGQEPVITASEVRVRYHLFRILGGHLDVDDIALMSPTISVIENPDGSGNLTPILEALQAKPSAKTAPPPAAPAKPMQIDLKKFTLSNATIRREQLFVNGGVELFALTNLNATLENVQNGQTGKFAIGAIIQAVNLQAPPGTNGSLLASLKGNFTFSLSPDLKPGTVQGQAELKVSRAEGTLSDLGTTGARLDCDITPTEVKRVSLGFQRSGAPVGELVVAGPFDLAKTEGRLKIDLTPLDKRALNLAGAAAGIDFGTTTISSTNTLQLTNAGSVVVVAGRFDADRFQLTHPGATTPSVDLHANYDLTLNRADQSAMVRTLTLTGVQNGNELLKATCSGTYGAANGNADLKVALRASLARLFQVFAQPNLTVSSGAIELDGRVTQKLDTQNIAGTLALKDFTGRVASNQFQKFSSIIDLDLRKTPAAIQINGIKGAFSQAGQAGGGFNLAGTYDLTNRSAQLKTVISDLNQNTLRPFLDPLLADKKLVSIAVNGNSSIQYSPAGDSTIQAGLQVTNLVVSDPQHAFTSTPLQAALKVDAGLQKQSADLRQFELTFTPTQRAKNQVNLKGHVDFANTNAIRGNLELAAESLDFTRYYDLFAGQTSESGRKTEPVAPATAPTAATTGANQEPPARKLPIQEFTADARIGRLYLHEVEITNWQTTVKIAANRVTVTPCQFTINGAPVQAEADLDLGIPGYKYGLTLNAKGIPFAPLVDTFHPDLKGAVHGTLSAQAQLRGQGTTGASLKKHFAGQFDVGTTNLDLSADKVRNPYLRPILVAIATLPEMVRNPAEAITIFRGRTSGEGGVSAEIMSSPIDVISARGTAGSGLVQLQQAIVRSPSFEIAAHGTISLADVLTNSPIQVPVIISLSRPVAAKINLVPANTPTNAAYVKLPDFVAETGTIGDPKVEINKTALAAAVLQGVGKSIPGTNIKPGTLLQDLTGALKGRSSGSTNASSNTSTNQPATNRSPVNNLLNDLLRHR